MRILIAAGGTGGHVYPALAVARSLRHRRGDLDLRWIGGHRGLEARVVPGCGHRRDAARASLAAFGGRVTADPR